MLVLGECTWGIAMTNTAGCSFAGKAFEKCYGIGKEHGVAPPPVVGATWASSCLMRLGFSIQTGYNGAHW